MDVTAIKKLPGIDRREDFVKLINLHGYKIGIEIGVDFGKFSAHLLGNSDLALLISLDGWGKYPQRKIEAEGRLNPFGNRSKIIVGLSPAAATLFADNYFDFVYIDGDHRLRPVRADIKAFWPKLRPGGLLAGHDYVSRRKCNVIPAVDEFVAANKVDLHVTCENGPELDDQLISWYFYKPKL